MQYEYSRQERKQTSISNICWSNELVLLKSTEVWWSSGGEHAWRRVRVPLDELAGRGHLPSKETGKGFETLQWLDAKCSIDRGITIRMVTAPAYRLKRLIWESTGSKIFKIATLSVIPVRVTAKQNGKKIFCSQMSRKKQKPLIQTTDEKSVQDEKLFILFRSSLNW
jgi:hypothetical protein